MTDTELRVFVYDRLLERARAPSSGEIADAFGVGAEDVRARLGTLRIGKTLLVDPSTGELWMAGPFAAAPTTSTLTDGATTWWANCIWDMFGVAVLVGRKLSGQTRCCDCGETLTIECDPSAPPPDTNAVAHFLLPAREWYADIGFT
jgi:hypothetical protein